VNIISQHQISMQDYAIKEKDIYTFFINKESSGKQAFPAFDKRYSIFCEYE
jgi:hypothetical protein